MLNFHVSLIGTRYTIFQPKVHHLLAQVVVLVNMKALLRRYWGISVMASEWSNTCKTCSRSLKASTLRRSLVCSKYVVQFFSIALWRRSLLIAILLESERLKRSRGMHFINVVRLKRNLKYEWKLWAEHVCANLADWLIRLSNHVCEGTWLDASARHGAQTLTNEICSDFEKSIHFSFDTTYSHRKQEAHDLF